MNMKKLGGIERLKDNAGIYARIQGLNREERKKCDFPKDIRTDLKKKENIVKLPLNSDIYRTIQNGRVGRKLLDIGRKNASSNNVQLKTVGEALRQYSDVKVTAQILRAIADWFCEEFDFIYIEGGALYIYADGYYQLFSNSYARRFFVTKFREYEINYAFRTSDYKELVLQIQSQPQIVRRQEDCCLNVNIVLFEDGAFDVRKEIMREPRQEDFQFSRIAFPLKWGVWYEPSPEARGFIQRFCRYDRVWEGYLWEVIGYLLSGYQKKILVMFIGPSNSGKSTLANLIRRICGSEACVALGIKELPGSFNLAELQGKRLCIDSEMDASALNAKDISLLKKVVGNDLLQGNRKFEQQFYFQCQTKFLICSNNKIRLQSNEDTISLLNRIKIFELKESIPLEEQCYDMDRILDENRTYFLQEAMKGLCRLVENNFQFSFDISAEDFVENIGCSCDIRSVQDFVDACCEFGTEYQVTVTDLYDSYKDFTTDNEMDQVSTKRFSGFLVENYEVIRGRTSKSRFFKGIRLMTDDR